MALVLRAKTGRNGEIKRFDVVSIGEDTEQAIQDVNEGTYHVFDGATVKQAEVSYRTVQDVVYK